MSNRFNVTLLGKVIGTALSYDFEQAELIQFYDFVPSENFPCMPCDTLAVFTYTGKLERYVAGDGAEEGTPSEVLDLLSALNLMQALSNLFSVVDNVADLVEDSVDEIAEVRRELEDASDELLEQLMKHFGFDVPEHSAYIREAMIERIMTSSTKDINDFLDEEVDED